MSARSYYVTSRLRTMDEVQCRKRAPNRLWCANCRLGNHSAHTVKMRHVHQPIALCQCPKCTKPKGELSNAPTDNAANEAMQ